MAEDPAQYTAELFGRCGYAATYIPAADLRGDAGRLQQLTDWVDRGIPVITWGHRTGVYAGYEDGGQTLLYITGDSGQPQRVTLDDALQAQGLADGWIFIGAKTASASSRSFTGTPYAQSRSALASGRALTVSARKPSGLGR